VRASVDPLETAPQSILISLVFMKISSYLLFTIIAWVTGCSGPPQYPAENAALSDQEQRTAAVGHATESLPPAAALRSVTDASELRSESLVGAVLARNPDLEALRHIWQAAAQRPAQARALEDPRLAYGFAPGTIESGGPEFGQRIDVSQKFPWPGKLRLRGEQAGVEAEGAFENLADARRLLAREARMAHSEWFYVHRAIAINRENQELLAGIQRLAEVKYAAGKASKQDALQAEVERHHLEHEAITLQRQRTVARARINTLLRRDTTAALPPPPSRLSVSTTEVPLKSSLPEAFENRPDLRALARRIEARRAGVELARLDYLPDFTVMGAYNSLWDAEEKRGFIGVGLELPIGEDRHAALAERRAELDAEEARFAAAVDRVALELTEAYEAVAESRHVVRLYRDEFIPSAEAHLDAARADYDAGEGDMIALLTAEQNLRTARLGLERALTDYHIHRAALQAAIGDTL